VHISCSLQLFLVVPGTTRLQQRTSNLRKHPGLMFGPCVQLLNSVALLQHAGPSACGDSLAVTAAVACVCVCVWIPAAGCQPQCAPNAAEVLKFMGCPPGSRSGRHGAEFTHVQVEHVFLSKQTSGGGVLGVL